MRVGVTVGITTLPFSSIFFIRFLAKSCVCMRNLAEKYNTSAL
jgi:hypothetical protein